MSSDPKPSPTPDDGTASVQDAERPVDIAYGTGFSAPKVTDTFYERFDSSPMAWAPDADGLPSPVGLSVQGSVPLTLGTLVCLEDRREFVVRGPYSGMVLARFTPAEVEQLPSGAHRAPASLALPRLAASRSLEALALARSMLGGLLTSGSVEVAPVRPRCRHFGRQMVDFPEEQSHQVVERMCMRRASTEGIPVSLMDSAMYACDLRQPRDLDSERRADAADERIIARSQERVSEGKFDVEATLDGDAASLPVGQARSAPSGGIFDRRY